jgi:trk system potassium uptake protein TrkA
MYIIIAGGGKVGYYLAKELLNEGHEVLIIERDKRKVDQIAEELGSVVLRGDACEATTLAEAGTNRADVVVAVTGDDEDNLVICQMAKKKFNVPRTIARINNPKNQRIFQLLGIDATVNSTDLIKLQIEQALPAQALVHLLHLRQANLEVVEARISDQARVAGRALREVTLPPDSAVLLVLRNGHALVPTPQTVLHPGDEVIALTKVEYEQQLRTLLVGS